MSTGEVPAGARGEHAWREVRRREVLGRADHGVHWLFPDDLRRQFGGPTGVAWLDACLAVGHDYRLR
jgi:hypothetical protein